MNPLPERTAVAEATALVVLAGGRGSRLDGELKPALEYRGMPLLTSVIAAVWRIADRRLPTVVVGDPGRLQPLTGKLPWAAEIRWTREDPAFGGPVAGLQAALELIQEPWLLLLAADLPEPAAGLQALFQAVPGPDGGLLVDVAGREQQLFGRYRVAPLRDAVQRAGSGTGAHPGKGPSLRSVIASLELARIPAPEQATADIDDWADAARWGIAKGTP